MTVAWRRFLLVRANSVLLKTQRRLKTRRVRGLPLQLNIEPVAACNLACPSCATGNKTANLASGLLSSESFARLLGRFSATLRRLIFYRWGEPFLHPGLLSMVALAEKAGVTVTISTNLNRFSRELARETVASGLSRLIVGIDGATQEVYQAHRRGGRIVRVLRHVKWIEREKRLQGRRTPRIIWRFVVFRHNERELEAARAMAARLGMEFDPIPANVTGGGGEEAESAQFGRGAFWKAQTSGDFCSSLWLGPAVDADGSIYPCCAVTDKRFAFGNAFTDDLLAVWNNAKFQAARDMVAGRVPAGDPDIPCTGCPFRPDAVAARLRG